MKQEATTILKLLKWARRECERKEKIGGGSVKNTETLDSHSSMVKTYSERKKSCSDNETKGTLKNAKCFKPGIVVTTRAILGPLYLI
ncbi:hypothetical protein H5410_043470 [Solanum commersonii]|uniref:Uncharacterized protein n=1 Tax=Solanum commersonii TaxID=4109 RepID=A0A9J5Y0T6_SOLCO|nr:hypothetical protein H5410_043470 [Solanum commersonii]